MTTAMLVAKERQLDWLLEHVLGGERTVAVPPARVLRSSWLAAAVALFAIGAAVGVALLRENEPRVAVQEPAQEPAKQIPWHECHGAGGLDKVPADATALHCFDFDDAACARLAKFTKLQQLDLSGTDVNEQGYSVSLHLTDAGVRALAPLTDLRWLSLSGCHDMKGEGLRVLEAMPRLEHLDFTYSGVESPAVERLDRLPSLRTLVLSHCMNFHGRSLATVAKIPGLRRLELQGCTTLAAKDVLPLVQLKELRHLDLRDCQGGFRGQTESGFLRAGEEEPPPPPVQDGIGITDAVVEALAALPLETFLLGGSESLTNAIGKPIAKMTTLRSLDLSNLPKLTGDALAMVPAGLHALVLDDNAHLHAADLARLPALPALREFGLSGLPDLDDATLKSLLADKRLQELHLGGNPPEGKDGAKTPPKQVTAGAAALVAAQRDLTTLDLRDAGITAESLAVIAALPKLRSLDLTAPLQNPLFDRTDAVRGLRDNTSLQHLQLIWCRLGANSLRELAKLPLRTLDVRGTNLRDTDVRAAAAAWPGCDIRMPKGQQWRAP